MKKKTPKKFKYRMFMPTVENTWFSKYVWTHPRHMFSGAALVLGIPRYSFLEHFPAYRFLQHRVQLWRL